MINNLNQLKSHLQQKLNGKDLREERCKHKDNTRCVIEEEIEALGVKPLRRPQSGKKSTKECSWDTWIAEDPPSLVYPMYLRPLSSYSNEVTPNLFSLACRIPLLDHNIYQYEIGPFLTASQSTKQLSHRYGYSE